MLLLEREDVEVRPGFVFIDARVDRKMGDHAGLGARRDLPHAKFLAVDRVLHVELERKRAQEVVGAEAHVREERAAAHLEDQEHVRARANDLCAVGHAPGEGTHAKANRAQHLEEQGVLLEAVPSAPAYDELVEHVLGLEANPHAQVNVEVLEWNGRRVREMDPAQHVLRRSASTLVPNALGVAVKIEGCHASKRTTLVVCARPVNVRV